MKKKYIKKLFSKSGFNAGFSLIELIVVISIMIILIAIVLPQVTGYIQTSRKESYRVNARTIYDMTIHALGLEPSLSACSSPEEAEPKIKQFIYEHDNLTPTGIDILHDPKIKIYYDSKANELWAEYHGIRFPTQYVEDPDNEEIDD
ncbi:MAG: prepilin-type N-terminal cleavage/methylation domain-containing protein [Firmicutes bacterium]|nr:prepilin-type N-terminal cleavage/methylation domain-containing protein [Bacillota bacterium]